MAMVWTVNNLKVSAIFSNNYSLISILTLLTLEVGWPHLGYALR